MHLGHINSGPPGVKLEGECIDDTIETTPYNDPMVSPDLTVTDDFIAYVQLARMGGIGPKRLKSCLARVGGDPVAALEDLELLMPGLSLGPPVSRSQAEDEIAAHERMGAILIGWGDPLYPSLLEEISDAPPLLSVRGNREVWARVLTPYPQTLGIVGARQASLNAQRLASLWSGQAASQGWTIISGLARGVDAAAHAGAMGADEAVCGAFRETPAICATPPQHVESGATIAVSGCGVDVCYPEENRALFEQMIHKHVVISEHALGQGPVAQHFPRRNRLISALSRGVLVVEAGLRSGSLITARCALEQNREIFVVPGFPLDPRYHGSNALIAEGAHLAQNLEEILSHLTRLEHARWRARRDTAGENRGRRETLPPRRWGPLVAKAGEKVSAHSNLEGDASASDPTTHLLSLLGESPTAYDDLWAALSREEGGFWTVPRLSTTLQTLEFQGLVQRHPGNTFSRINQ